MLIIGLKTDPREDYDAVNPLMPNGLAHHYHLGEPTFIIRGLRSGFKFLFHFSIKFL